MKMSDGIKNAYARRWSMINTFTVQIEASEKLRTFTGVSFDDNVNLNIISFTTPDFTNNPIEVFVANRWRIHNGHDSLYKFQITFRDEQQMALYKAFMSIYDFTKDQYFDDASLTITVNKDADWANESEEKEFIKLSGCLVEGVSNVSFNNTTENQIAEFTVSFKCNKYEMGTV